MEACLPEPEWFVLSGREELRKLCDQRRLAGCRTTNLIIGNERVSAAADAGRVRTLANDAGAIILFDDMRARRIYFIEESWDAAALALARAAPAFDQRTVIDMTGREGSFSLFEDLCSRSGFGFYKCFRRMSRRPVGEIPGTEIIEIPRIAPADVEMVLNMILNVFDPLAEFLPNLAELETLLKNGAIWAAQNIDGKLRGFLVHEAIGNTSLLRYVAVAAEERGNGLGGALITQYLRDTSHAIRHDLWVWERNDAAIRHYLANGFAFTGLYNVIYQFKE